MKQEQQHKDLMRRAVRHLLVTDDDVMNEAERIVGHTLQRENQGDEGCLTVTEIARELDMEARDLNSFLRDKGIQKWKQGQYRLTPKYEGRGLRYGDPHHDFFNDTFVSSTSNNNALSYSYISFSAHSMVGFSNSLKREIGNLSLHITSG